jgi:hypothetical protein
MFGQSVIVDMQVKEREREKLQAVEVSMEEFLQEVHKVKQYFSLGICADGFEHCEMFHFCDKLPLGKYFLHFQ